jgi:drug/metabolite transporter (DMT)-like permease
MAVAPLAGSECWKAVPAAAAWWVVGVAISGVLAQTLFALSFVDLPASIAGTLALATLPAGVALDALVTHDLPSGVGAVGYGLVVAGVGGLCARQTGLHGQGAHARSSEALN